jgi:hypothetical protein
VTGESEMAALPDELIPRTATLLVRGAPTGFLAFFLLVTSPSALMGYGAFSIANPQSRSLPLFFAMVFMLAGACAMPIATHASFLAAFSLAVEGHLDLAATLRRALAAAPRIMGYVLIEMLLVGASFVLGPGGVVLATWLHGAFLIGCAHVACDGWWKARLRAGEKRDAALVGGVPLVALVMLVAGSYVHELGVGIMPVPKGGPAVVAGVVAMFSGHVLSCALAVAAASRGDVRPEQT